MILDELFWLSAIDSGHKSKPRAPAVTVAKFWPNEAVSLRSPAEATVLTVDDSLLAFTLAPAVRESSWLRLYEEEEAAGGPAGRPPLDFANELYP